MSAVRGSFSRRYFSAAVFCAAMFASMITGPMFGQDFKTPDGRVPLPIDWSTYHLIYPAGYSAQQASHMQSDPRFFVQTRLHGRELGKESAAFGFDTLSRRSAADMTGGSASQPAKATKKKQLAKDWSVSLGAGGVAAGMYPAKFVFDANAAPNCANDFAVFPVNDSTGSVRAHAASTFSATTGSPGGQTVEFSLTPTGKSPITLTLTSSTTVNTGLNFEVIATPSTANATTEAANLAAAINRNLSSTALGEIAAVASTNSITVYSLTAGSAETLAVTNAVTGLGTFTITTGTSGAQANIVAFNTLYSGSSPFCTGATYPKFIFSYASGVGPVATSPSISLYGNEIAYVENDPNMGAILHVLQYATGSTEYGSCTAGGSSSAPTCATFAVIPGSTASSTATDYMLPLGLVANATTAIDSYSSPFIDYNNFTAYVGDNGGYLYAVANVFNGGKPAHAGGNFPVTVTAGADLTGPVVDTSETGDIYVGDSTGLVKGITSAGTLLSGSVTVGTSGDNGVRDTPIWDSTNEVGYATGCSGTGSNTGLRMVQFYNSSGTMATHTSVAEGGAGACRSATYPTYNGALDNLYYTQGINSGHALFCAFDNSSTGVFLYQFTFSSGVMSSTPGVSLDYGTGADNHICSPVTEFYGDDISYTPTAVGTTAGTPTTVTVTTPTNSFVTGQVVTIAGVTAGTNGCSTGTAVAEINGEQTITRLSATQFTFTIPLTTTGAAGVCALSSPTAIGPTQDYWFFGTTLPEAFTFTAPITGTSTPLATNTTSVSGGTSAMTVDNDSSDGQASSLYFGTLTTSTGECGTTVYCAVKLTQALLQ